MRRITRLTTVLLSGLLSLLGFSGCHSARNAQREMEAEQQRQDSIARAERDRQAQKEAIREREREQQQKRNNEMRLLYGPPPSRYIKNIDK